MKKQTPLKTFRNKVYRAFQREKLKEQGFSMPSNMELEFALKYKVSPTDVVDLIRYLEAD